MTSTTTTNIRRRRERLNISRTTLAIRARVSISWVSALEAGMEPVGSKALQRVEAALDQFEAERSGWQLEPGVGRSGYRGDTSGPEAA